MEFGHEPGVILDRQYLPVHTYKHSPRPHAFEHGGLGPVFKRLKYDPPEHMLKAEPHALREHDVHVLRKGLQIAPRDHASAY
jgi:hypothetical protein